MRVTSSRTAEVGSLDTQLDYTPSGGILLRIWCYDGQRTELEWDTWPEFAAWFRGLAHEFNEEHTRRAARKSPTEDRYIDLAEEEN